MKKIKSDFIFITTTNTNFDCDEILYIVLQTVGWKDLLGEPECTEKNLRIKLKNSQLDVPKIQNEISEKIKNKYPQLTDFEVNLLDSTGKKL